uniref:Uncharacterized protein n=1 Tax=Micrurus corallinus TaxID=54390 RepID=A0A2D4ENM0_MICCO
MAICATSRTGENWCPQSSSSSSSCALQGSRINGEGSAGGTRSHCPTVGFKCSTGVWLSCSRPRVRPLTVLPLPRLPSLDDNKQVCQNELDGLLQTGTGVLVSQVVWLRTGSPGPSSVMWFWCSLGWMEDSNPRPALPVMKRRRRKTVETPRSCQRLNWLT